MKIDKNNRAFLKKGKGGKFIANMNVDGEQKLVVFYPNLDDDGLIKNWGGNISDNIEEE